MLIPKDILEVISFYLSYSDILNLTLVNKDFSFLREDEYYRRRLRMKEEESQGYLTYRGMYLHLLSVEKGEIHRGSENFIPLHECLIRAYQREDSLLDYFLRVSQTCPYLTPIKKMGMSRQVDIQLENILKMCIRDGREDIFLLVLPYLGEIKDLVPLYILAKRNGMDQVRKRLASLFTLELELDNWVPYCVTFKDEVMFRDIFPYIRDTTITQVRGNLKGVYKWPEVSDICPPMDKVCKSPYSEDKTKIVFPMIDTVCVEYFRGEKSFLVEALLSGRREDVRKYLLKGISKEDMLAIRNLFPCSNITTRDLYTTYFKFSVGSLHQKVITIPKSLPEITDKLKGLRISGYYFSVMTS